MLVDRTTVLSACSKMKRGFPSFGEETADEGQPQDMGLSQAVLWAFLAFVPNADGFPFPCPVLFGVPGFPPPLGWAPHTRIS